MDHAVLPAADGGDAGNQRSDRPNHRPGPGRAISGAIIPAWLLYPIVLLLVLANTINLGPISARWAMPLHCSSAVPPCFMRRFCTRLRAAAGFCFISALLKVLKWLTLVLFSYVGTAFWSTRRGGTRGAAVLRRSILTAIIGPCSLRFWGPQSVPTCSSGRRRRRPKRSGQIPTKMSLKNAPEQAREQFGRIRMDTYLGMAFSNLVAFFIILSAAVTLHAHGITDIETSSQAAEALRPLAGTLAFTVFALGIVGTGLLAVPVLAGSAAYAVGEALKWPTGLDRKPLDAKGFYGVLAAATLMGLTMNFPVVQRLPISRRSRRCSGRR